MKDRPNFPKLKSVFFNQNNRYKGKKKPEWEIILETARGDRLCAFLFFLAWAFYHCKMQPENAKNENSTVRRKHQETKIVCDTISCSCRWVCHRKMNWKASDCQEPSAIMHRITMRLVTAGKGVRTQHTHMRFTARLCSMSSDCGSNEEHSCSPQCWLTCPRFHIGTITMMI